MLTATYKEPISCKTVAFHCHCTCSYTTRVVWQTKCKLVMYISRVSHVFAIPHAHAKIACNSACTCQFFSFARVKHANTRVYLHTCVKFKLSCTILPLNDLIVSIILLCMLPLLNQACLASAHLVFLNIAFVWEDGMHECACICAYVFVCMCVCLCACVCLCVCSSDIF